MEHHAPTFSRGVGRLGDRGATAARQFINRDPIGLAGGVDLYAYVGNNGVNFVDNLGLWKEPDRKLLNWASIAAEDGDTWQGLADKLHLELADVAKWVKNYEPTPQSGKCYSIPNTFVFYIAHMGVLDSWLPFDLVSLDANHIKTLESQRTSEGFNVISYNDGDDTSLFNSLWASDGIYGIGFSGHGLLLTTGKFAGHIDGFVSGPSNNSSTSHPGTVTPPPYKLAFIWALHCGSYRVLPGGNEGWQKFLSSNNGKFFGYDNDDMSYFDILFPNGSVVFGRKAPSGGMRENRW